jgi:hypothetical protein
VAAVTGGLFLTGQPPTVAATAASIQVCNRSGYMFDVYADGPSVREDDLAGYSKGGACTDWANVLPGSYQIGFGLHPAGSGANGGVIVQARLRRNHYVYYRTFNNEGVFSSRVGPGDVVMMDLMIPQG